MTDVNVSDADIDALATKLDAMSDQFTGQEQATLRAVFALAGSAVQNAAGEVEGFAVDMFNQGINFSLNFTNQAGLPGAFQGGIASHDISVKVGGVDHKVGGSFHKGGGSLIKGE